MLTAIITDLCDEARMEATLAALAPAAIDGFIRQLLVIADGADAAALELAEDAGADAVAGPDGFAAACAQARQPWLLILPAGVRPQMGWEAAVRAHARRDRGAAGYFIGASADAGFVARVGEGLAGVRCALLGQPTPAQGLLVTKVVAAGLGAPNGEVLARKLGRGRLRAMGARALAPTTHGIATAPKGRGAGEAWRRP